MPSGVSGRSVPGSGGVAGVVVKVLGGGQQGLFGCVMLGGGQQGPFGCVMLGGVIGEGP